MLPNSAFSYLLLLLLSPHIAHSSHLPSSSPRKTINYGPNHPSHSIKTSIHNKHNPSNHHLDSILIQFNANSSPPTHLGQLDSADQSSFKRFGIELASQFIRQFHHQSPSLTFQLTSAHISKHTSVLHAYFVQTILSSDRSHHIKVHNAVANLNIDLDPKSRTFGHILSHSDSFHPLTENPSSIITSQFFDSFVDQRASRCSQLKRDFDTALQSLTSNPQLLNQQVIGIVSPRPTVSPQDTSGRLLTDFSEDELRIIAECEMETEGNRLIQSNDVVDPRIALVSFLTLAADLDTQNHLTSRSLDDLVLSIDIVRKPSSTSLQPSDQSHPSDHSEDSPVFELYNVPGALSRSDSSSDSATGPTAAELAWLSVDDDSNSTQSGKRDLKLVWRFEYRSNSNWYESYVDARSPGLVPMVVDWIKDFRPTSELAPTHQEHLFMKSSLIEEFNRFHIPNPSRLGHSASLDHEIDLPLITKGATEEPRPSSYRVFPWSVNDPTQGKREIVQDPSDSIASPLGWHTIPPTHRNSNQRDLSQLSSGWSRGVERHGLRATDTRGNNVYAQENWEGLDNWEANYRPNGTDELMFHFHLGWNHTNSPSETHVNPRRYIDAAVSELFYTCNEFHDLTHRYGFDEESGNFQQNNFGRGGKGGDAVIANAQDGSGYNNANFATPPDGRNGRMRMYVWNGAEPWRDGDLEAGIVIHEYSHGVSTRLTGGPANSGCLGWGEAGGMGEGWGDFFATLIRMHKAKPVDFTMGEWASGVKGGIRNYKYSLDNKVNPETYETLDKRGYWGVHAIGEVWAEMLFTVAEELIAKHGFEPSLFPPVDKEDSADFYKTAETSGKKVPARGNTLIFQLLLDGMKIQKCRPGFFDARDSILEADFILTGGENQCEIWRGFSKRGLGPKATLKGSTPWGGGIRTNDFSLPRGVCEN